MSKGSPSCAFGCFVGGLSVGFLATLLFAPQSGEETRKTIRRKAVKSMDHLAAQGKARRRETEDITAVGRGAIEDLDEGAGVKQ